MKNLFLGLILTCASSFSSSIYTLDNVHSLNLYLANETEFLDKEKKEKLKSDLTKKLEKAGFIFGQTDATILVIKIQSLAIEESLAINISVGLGEEIITKRKDKIESFAYTYLESKFIEGYDPYEDTIEALDSLIDDFISAYKDDNEE